MLQCLPGVEQRYALVVDDVAVGVSGILFVAGLEGEGGVDEVEIDVVELESFEAGFEGGFHALGAVVGVPEFCDDEEVVAFDFSIFEDVLDGFANFFFGAVTFGRVEGAKAGFKGGFGRGSGCDGVGDERAEAERGDGAGVVVEGKFGKAEVVGVHFLFWLLRAALIFIIS